MNSTVQALRSGLIVSCQAYPDSPMYGETLVAAMAKSAEAGGAAGIRACWADNIRAVKAACGLPVIGIHKLISDGPMRPDRVYITPTFEAAAETIEAGCDILGMDFTPRDRDYRDIERLVERIRRSYPGIPIMADISTLEEGVMAERLGADIVSTTLSGYTVDSILAMRAEANELMARYQATGEIPEFAPDYALISALKSHVHVPVNAEGRFWERSEAVRAFEAGADMLTIGSAITAPDAITKRFVRAIRQRLEAES